MPARRLEVPPRQVTVSVDGTPISAAEGEPVAAAIVASGRWVFGRSVKYHRPRGPACMAGHCDGCLMRVDGIPNVMTCRQPVSDGMCVETQNVLGSAETDLLSVTDWFFAEGMDHHTMFTRFRAMNRVMQRVARRIAGIGTLPDRVVDTAPPRAVSADVLVVGGGIAGLSAAIAAARAGADVLLAEEGAELGGWFSLLYRCSRSPGPPLARLIAAAEAAGVRVLLGHSVVSITDGIAFAAGPECGVVVRPKRLIVATGSHEGAVAIPGNDLPAVLTCRGALELLARGILPGQRVLVVGDVADLGPLRPLLAFAGVTVLGPYRAHQVVALKGRPWIKAAEVREHGDDETSVRVACDAVVLAARPSGAYELAAQAGAAVVFRDGGFFVDADELGRTANPWVRAAGQCAGGGYARFKSLVHAAQRVGREIARELGAEAAS